MLTTEQIAQRLLVLLVGDDSPKMHAQVTLYLALYPPPPRGLIDNVRSITVEQFDAAMDKCGGAEAVRRSFARAHGLTPAEVSARYREFLECDVAVG